MKVAYRSVIKQTNNESGNATIEETMKWYTNVTGMFLDHLSNQIKESDSSGVWRFVFQFVIFVIFINCSDCILDI